MTRLSGVCRTACRTLLIALVATFLTAAAGPTAEAGVPTDTPSAAAAHGTIDSRSVAKRGYDGECGLYLDRFYKSSNTIIMAWRLECQDIFGVMRVSPVRVRDGGGKPHDQHDYKPKQCYNTAVCKYVVGVADVPGTQSYVAISEEFSDGSAAFGASAEPSYTCAYGASDKGGLIDCRWARKKF